MRTGGAAALAAVALERAIDAPAGDRRNPWDARQGTLKRTGDPDDCPSFFWQR